MCERCSVQMDFELHQAKSAAKEEVQTLHAKLEEFENEAMCELEELQSELLEARASNEDLRQQLGESEHKRYSEQYHHGKLAWTLTHCLQSFAWCQHTQCCPSQLCKEELIRGSLRAS